MGGGGGIEHEKHKNTICGWGGGGQKEKYFKKRNMDVESADDYLRNFSHETRFCQLSGIWNLV